MILGIIIGLIVGSAGGWGLTYLYFHKDKVRAQIAKEVNDLKKKISDLV